MNWFIGLDLGQAADFTALAAIEQLPPELPAPERPRHLYQVRHLKRWKLGTSYPEIVDEVRNLVATGPLYNSTLLVDGTGVGRAVVDLFRACRPKLNAAVVPVSITGGSLTNADNGGWNVPKKDLVAALQLLLQSKRLKIAHALPDAKVLQKELRLFRVKINIGTGNESFEAWRERDHDDLVLSVAMAAWFAERGKRQLQVWT